MRDTHVASSVVDVLRVATDGGARELLRVVLGEAPGAAGGCAVVGAVDGARAANLFGEVEDDSSCVLLLALTGPGDVAKKKKVRSVGARFLTVWEMATATRL